MDGRVRLQPTDKTKFIKLTFFIQQIQFDGRLKPYPTISFRISGALPLP